MTIHARARALALSMAGLLAFALAAHAETLSLGSMTLYRTKGQPTYAEIALSGSAQGEVSKLRARVASPEAYRAAGLRYAPTLGQIAVSARPLGDGRAGLRIDIPEAAADGSLDLLLLVGDAVSVAMAEYRLDFNGTARVFPALEAGTALIPTTPPPPTAATKGTPPPVAKAPAASAATGVAAARPPASVAASAPPVVAAARPAPPASAASAAPAVASAAATEAASALAAWAEAWSRRDVDAYLAAYAPDFTGRTKPATHAAWAAERRQRIESKSSIEVRVSALSVVPRSNLMVLSFSQSYAADTLKQVSRKRLVMRQEGGRWLIQEETELP